MRSEQENKLNYVKLLSNKLNGLTVEKSVIERLSLTEGGLKEISRISDSLDDQDKLQRTKFFYQTIYALGCLDALYALQEELVRSGNDADLGAKDQKSICTLLDIVISWIILPQIDKAAVRHLTKIPEGTGVPWISSYCKRFLSSLLINENGLIDLIHVLFPSDKDHADICKIQAISSLVATAPSFMDAKLYYTELGCQIACILSVFSDSKLEYTIAVSIIVSICSKNPNLGYSAIVHPFVDRFALIDAGIYIVEKYATLNLDIGKKKIIASAEYVSRTLKLLERMLDNTGLSPKFATCLLRLVPQLYCLYEAEHDWKEDVHRDRLLDIMTRILRNCDIMSVCSTLKFIQIDMYKTSYIEISRDEFGLPLLILNKDPIRKTINTTLFANLISHTALSDIVGDIFIYLLDVMDYTSEILYDDKILMIDVILHLISDENYCKKLLKKSSQLLDFATNLLSSKDEKFLSLAIGLVYALITSNEITLDLSLRPRLQKVNINLTNLSNNKETPLVISNASNEVRMLINSLEIMKIERPVTPSHSPLSSDDAELIIICIGELSHEILPVRAHAMSKLRALVDKKSDDIPPRLESIFTTVFIQLSHEDSFLYLNAIRLICSLVVNYPHIFLDRVLSLYNDQTDSLDVRIRIGEVILQSVHLFGQIFPRFSDIYINRLINNLGDNEPKIKASTLSIISLIAEKKPLSLSRYIYTILENVKNILIFEKDLEVRRGATSVLSALSYYVENIAPSSENLSVLRQVYAILKKLALDDGDEVVRITSKSFVNYLKNSLF